MTVRCEDTEYDLMAAKFGINGYAVLTDTPYLRLF